MRPDGTNNKMKNEETAPPHEDTVKQAEELLDKILQKKFYIETERVENTGCKESVSSECCILMPKQAASEYTDEDSRMSIFDVDNYTFDNQTFRYLDSPPFLMCLAAFLVVLFIIVKVQIALSANGIIS